ncbi:DNA polymerase III epsilon subunit family exonuclease [Oceaniovalibus guishaninsula JLT2003]|uniref:DNA-directed DNA polymerase n=1 Tax=Oceaniovalibus guishaninsula JLT2003 TaxID=1231392 RepID=K2GRZ8_9RHOB|nr:exonuclease domain-containing protein [Oceaniovalibus guishaninsula]EKE45416.1 DNA polymerase III epsilon subunit family exonuclease [Oceaniovalibus guishaninsula JLT2003]
MRAGLRLRIFAFFLLVAAASIAAVGLGAWLAWRRMPEALPALLSAGAMSAFGIALVTMLVWLLFDEHVAKGVTRLAAGLRARAHGGVVADLDSGPVRHLGDLGPAAAAICAQLAQAEARAATRLADQTRRMAADNAHLAAILSEIPVAIMVVDERDRIRLYDRQCVHVLGHVSALCLGRSVHDWFDRDSLRAALELLDERSFADVDLLLRDGRTVVATRIRPAAQGRGYMLAMEVEDDVVAERPLVFEFDVNAGHLRGSVGETPLSELACVIFDTETTGLDTARDEIVQIGAVRVLNGTVVPGERFDMLVNPGRPIPPLSARVHGITDDMVRDAADVETALRRFHDFARDAVLVAHNAPFDLAFLRRREEGLGLAFDNPVLDTVLLSAALFGQAETHTLDAIAERLNVRIDGSARHTALGDAIATATVLLRLIPMLEAQNIRTFGDAVTAMRRHERLLPDANRQADAKA